MVTKTDIESYIARIPPSSRALRETLDLLRIADLTKAAKVASSDPALRAYLVNIVNKPIYGFSHQVSDVAQIFSIFGVSLSLQSVHNYMISLLNPKKWELFKLSQASFVDLQAGLSKRWEKILSHLNIKDPQIFSAISLLPASIIVTEAIFSSKKADVDLLRSSADIDYNTILKRLTTYDLFDICEMIAHRWDLDPKIAAILQTSSGKKPSTSQQINTLGKWMHLLLFYELSRPAFTQAGLNDFLEFEVDFTLEIQDEFMALMEVGE
ncbi:MAG: HDOD domain-containing protein [Sulfuricurvum sp.]